MSVKAKKHLGQHFLTDKNICEKIAKQYQNDCKRVLEIGPGMGALTSYLLNDGLDVWVMEIDWDSVAYLKANFDQLEGKVFSARDDASDGEGESCARLKAFGGRLL